MFKDNRERVSRDKLIDFFFGLFVFLIEPQTGGWLINRTLSKVTTVKGNDGTTHGRYVGRVPNIDMKVFFLPRIDDDLPARLQVSLTVRKYSRHLFIRRRH